MKNLKAVAKASECARWDHTVPIYYDFETEEVLTESMMQARGLSHVMKCTELIRKCSEKEIEAFVYRAMWM